MKRPSFAVVLVLPLVIPIHGCGQPTHEAEPAWRIVSESQMTGQQAAQRDKALAARHAMFTALKGRLMEVVGTEGPAAAIAVCSKEAPRIAERISQEHRLAIGRTSFRLRNTNNAPPEWATQLVADRVGEPTYLTRGDKVAALLPIQLQAPCLMCHGPGDAIPPEVTAALAEHYPEDQATGFQEGDLRGWFWVEVPGGNDS
jgi:hypothetical protein